MGELTGSVEVDGVLHSYEDGLNPITGLGVSPPVIRVSSADRVVSDLDYVSGPSALVGFSTSSRKFPICFGAGN